MKEVKPVKTVEQNLDQLWVLVDIKNSAIVSVRHVNDISVVLDVL